MKFVITLLTCFLIKLSIQDDESIDVLKDCIKDENLNIPDFQALVEVLKRNDMDTITRLYGCTLRKIGFPYEIRTKILDTCREQTAGVSKQAYAFANCCSELTKKNFS